TSPGISWARRWPTRSSRRCERAARGRARGGFCWSPSWSGERRWPPSATAGRAPPGSLDTAQLGRDVGGGETRAPAAFAGRFHNPRAHGKRRSLATTCCLWDLRAKKEDSVRMRTRRLMAAAFVALFLMVPSLASAQYNEAPMLRALVEQGLLPPVEERLPIPEDIVVIEPVEEIGQYGGTWRTLHDNPDPGVLKMILYDPGVRWNRDYTEYIPGVFRAWEFSEDGRSVTFYLRRGLKWSDGVEFTTEDLRFWWEDLANDPSYGAVPPPWWGFVDGELMTVDFIDKYTIRFNFPAPNWNVPYVLPSGFWNWEPMMAPRDR